MDDQDNRLVWEALTENARGQLTSEQRGNKITSYVFNSKGLPTSIQTPGIVNLSYDFLDEGNLLYRQDGLSNQKEVFTYDELNRLTAWDVYQNDVLEKSDSIIYSSLGNIQTKTAINMMFLNLMLLITLGNTPLSLIVPITI